MATISLSDAAPKEAIHFSLANVDFDLEGSGTYETEQPDAIASAASHPWLKVEVDPAAAAPVVEPDENDPHVNPTIDHLSVWASQEAVDEAAANEAATLESVGFDSQVSSPDEAPDTPPTQAPVATNSPPVSNVVADTSNSNPADKGASS